MAEGCQRAIIIVVARRYFNFSFLVLLIFLSFLFSSLRCKASCLVDNSVLLLFVYFLLFWDASERGSDFVKESIFLVGYVSWQRGVVGNIARWSDDLASACFGKAE